MKKDFQILLFYCYAEILDTEKFKTEHHLFCIKNNIKGRIIISSEGINGGKLKDISLNSMNENCGIIVNVTPLEPGWEGHVTLEFSNTTTLPAKIYAGEGVAQMIFLESDEDCEVSYKDRDGKYQGQKGVTLPKT